MSDGTQFSNGLQGAAGGAMAGAGFGPLGAVIGGGLGLLGGLFGNQGSDAYQQQLAALAKQFGQMQAPQAGPAAQAGYSGFRQNQAGLVSQLEAMARGEGPSAATLMMKQAMDRAAAAQASAAAGAGGRGVNAGAALRNATNNTAMEQMQTSQQAAQARVAEQLGAIDQLGGVINQGRAADEGVNQFNAGQTNAMSQANLQAELQTLGIKSQGQLDALKAAAGVAGTPTGTSILAGGAMALPAELQYLQRQNNGGAPGTGGGTPMSDPWGGTSPGVGQQFMNWLSSLNSGGSVPAGATTPGSGMGGYGWLTGLGL